MDESLVSSLNQTLKSALTTPSCCDRYRIGTAILLVCNPVSHSSILVMFTYLHHSDPTIPHYRKEEWSFVRGVLATVDRPLLGWMGRFFLHNVSINLAASISFFTLTDLQISHDHIAHHLFVTTPFCMYS